jgi:HD-like signal output (HDOD) protein
MQQENMGILHIPRVDHMINQPLPNLELWTQALQRLEIPVLPATAADIAELNEVETNTGQLDAHTLTQSIANDPLMTLKVLAHVSEFCTQRHAEPPETLKSALIMLGIGPFFRQFNALSEAPAHLHQYPSAWEGLVRVIERSRRAAFFAAHFAMQRQDEDAEVIQEAALLHDAGEMLLWCHAPVLMQQVTQQLQADDSLLTADAQRKLLGIESIDLTQTIMRAWQLSPLLCRCTDDRHAEHQQVQNVTLAVRLAAHTQDGWDCPKAQSTREADMRDVAELLTISPEAAERKMCDLNE